MVDIGGLPVNVGGVDGIWIMIIIGVLFAFFGKTFFKAVWFLIGGLVGALIGGVIGALVGLAIGQPMVCGLIAALVGFIIGGYLGISWARWLICLAAAAAGFAIGSLLGGLIVGIVVAIVLFIIIYIKFDDVLSIMTAIIGGAIIGGVATTFFGPNPILFLGVSIPVAIVGMYVQLQIHKRYPDHSYNGEEDPRS